jgi:hypothetical protein
MERRRSISLSRASCLAIWISLMAVRGKSEEVRFSLEGRESRVKVVEGKRGTYEHVVRYH